VAVKREGRKNVSNQVEVCCSLGSNTHLSACIKEVGGQNRVCTLVLGDLLSGKSRNSRGEKGGEKI